MTHFENDTIAAVATAQGEGGIAIVRVSGEDALSVLKRAFRPAGKRDFSGRRLVFGTVVEEDGSVIDEAMAVFMPAPKTYTREDVAEIQCHGGRIVSERVLERVLACGARRAHRGEFTQRAFLNGRIDLSQAEAVMQLISASNAAMARSAVRQMEGGASGFVKKEIDALTHALSMIEASDDFPEEIGEESFLDEVTQTVAQCRQRLLDAADPKRARMLREGVSVVLRGKTNAGKSSLLNALVGQDRAIVTDIPGTTRDVLTATLDINGIRLEISDTAGQRETKDAVEAIGVERAKNAARDADIVLLVLDGASPLEKEDRALLAERDERAIVVANKRDIATGNMECDIALSAKTGEGVSELLDMILQKSGAMQAESQQITAQRHIEKAREAVECLSSALSAIEDGFAADIAAADIMAALAHLTEITGENASEMVIDRVFRDFCVGK